MSVPFLYKEPPPTCADMGVNLVENQYSSKVVSYFCLFFGYIQSRSQKQIDPFDESQIELRSNIFDIDFNKEINNGRYLVLADLARINHGFFNRFFFFS